MSKRLTLCIISTEFLLDKFLLELPCWVSDKADKVTEDLHRHDRGPEVCPRKELIHLLVNNSAHVDQILRPEVDVSVQCEVLLLLSALARPITMDHPRLKRLARTKERVHRVTLR